MKAKEIREGWSLRSYYTFFVVLILLSLLFITLYAAKSFRSFFVAHLSHDLEGRARAVVSEIVDGAPLPLESKRAVCSELGDIYQVRVTVVALDGSVVCDSDADRTRMDNHGDRPEISGALVGAVRSKIRRSQTLEADLLYVAVPVSTAGKIQGAVRTALPLTEIDRHLQAIVYQMIGVGVLITAIVGLVSYLLYRRINPPLDEMRRGAKRFETGQFDQRLPQYKIKEIAKLALAMNRMGAQLKHLEGVRSDFVANVSHELKTPITSITGFVETLLDGAMEDPHDLKRFLEIISKQSERLTAIIEDLLTLSRLESEQGDALLLIEEAQVLNIMQSAADVCKARAEVKEISIETDGDSQLTATVDRSLIEQAITNLVDNAIKYSGPKSVVRLSADAVEDRVCINVTDQGPGIPREHLSRLFERFYRVDKARSRNLGGTGLGLAIVKHVASVHRGTVEVESEVGQGTTFSISIPRTNKKLGAA